MRNLNLIALCLAATFMCCAIHAGEADSADLTLRMQPNQSVRYQWTASAINESTGRQAGKPFALKNEMASELVLVVRGRNRSGEGLPLAAKVEDYTRKDKATIAEQSADIEVSKTRVKATENGKVLVDSDNDIGLDEIKAHRERVKQLLAGEAHLAIDQSGKLLGEVEGDPLVIDALKTAGLEGVLRMLPGRTIRVGESWDDAQPVPTIGAFRLAKPAIVRSKSTFTGWEEKGGTRLARIEIATKWDSTDLKGENDDHMLVEITRVEGASTGVCFFDPAKGEFAEGKYDTSGSYRLDGTKDGQSMGLEVTAKTGYSFKRMP